MPEPTARDALQSFGAELDRLASEVDAGDLGTGLALAAQLARQRALSVPQPSPEVPAPQESTEGERGSSVGLSIALEALAERTAQDPGSVGMKAARWHAVVALDAAEPVIRADERERVVSGYEARLVADQESTASVLIADAVAAERERLTREHVAERDLIHTDLGQLLDALGLGDGARPESPHEVMLQCVAEVRRLRAAHAVLTESEYRATLPAIGAAMEAAREVERDALAMLADRMGATVYDENDERLRVPFSEAIRGSAP